MERPAVTARRQVCGSTRAEIGRLAVDEGSCYLLAETKRRDPDRYLCALFAPADRRDSVLALVLFNDELARILKVVTQPMTGLIRLRLLETSYGVGVTVSAGDGLTLPAGATRDIKFAKRIGP